MSSGVDLSRSVRCERAEGEHCVYCFENFAELCPLSMGGAIYILGPRNYRSYHFSVLLGSIGKLNL